MADIGAVVHLTDLHLLVDQHGKLNDKPTRQRLLLLQKLGKLGHGLDCAHPSLVWDLVDALPEVVEEELNRSAGKPVVVVHTGDAEAHGQTGPVAFGYRFLEDELWSVLRKLGPVTIVQVYGNHDLWSGTLVREHARWLPDLSCQVSDFATRSPNFLDIGRLRFIRLNTVSRRALSGGLLALPKLGSHPHGQHWAAPLTSSFDSNQVNVVLTHHPIIDERLGKVDGFIKSALNQPMHVVISGHTHTARPHRADLDPDRHPSRTVALAPHPAGRVGQLVGESPTQVAASNSFSVYRFDADFGVNRLCVDRLAFDGKVGAGFSAQPIEPALHLGWL